MQRFRVWTALSVLAFFLAACNFPSSPTANPPASQPDLTITFMYIEMEGRQGYCVTVYSPYGMRVKIENIGSADAGPFFAEVNGNRQMVEAGLAAGQFVELHFAGTTPSGRYDATVDATDQVVESREDNNTRSYLAPTPTPPPLCTGTPPATP